MKTPLFTDEIKDFIKENAAGIYTKDLSEIVNKKFGTSYSEEQIRDYKSRNKIRNGLSGRFEKGHVPFNKGRKGFYYKGCEKGWFEKGNVPKNHKPVGSERINTDGYVEVKTAEPNIWELKHQKIYRKHFGKIPKGFIVTFKDGNKENTQIENLLLMSRAESAVMSKFNLRGNRAEINKAGLNVAKVILKISERMNKKGKTEKC